VGSRVLLVSYVPLLRGMAGTLIEEDVSGSLERLLTHLPSGTAQACLWLESAGKPRPVLVLDRAKMIADHLVEWAEGDPSSWFRLAICEHGGRYALVLFPNLRRSLDRFKLARQLTGHRPGLREDEVMFVSRPLHFVSGPEHIYQKIQHRIGRHVELGLLDRSDLNPECPESFNERRIRELGWVRLGGEPTAEQFARQLMADTV
jgi:hypothetical protein